ncbi:hypothetical protein PSACC_02433 [Paramicrosporidium saccamoebae]|uniref:Uncharacterized protein n=1 Tax=Paramicrosporidium saccamoebae TaxID=1246581 RepID=A0A2H9TJA5_9FUNG|nr:hypothetical protein PSACC_02433 [Paramicrosporidium saccamoebae]
MPSGVHGDATGMLRSCCGDAAEEGDFTIIGKFATGFLLFTHGTQVFLGDQHAIHERIRLEMLENYSEAIGDSGLTVQDVEFLKKKSTMRMDEFKTRACKGSHVEYKLAYGHR